VQVRQRVAVMVGLILGVMASGPSVAQSSPGSGAEISHAESAVPGLHDFDFLVGHWRVHHRKLKERLANSHEWIEFEGTLFSQSLMLGYSNVDDLVLNVPDAPYRGVALRSFDPKSQQWIIWWLDSCNPLGSLDPPMRGRFKNGVGTFYGDDTLNGKLGHASSGPASPLRPVTGSKRSRQMAVRRGGPIGRRTSYEYADRED
jgi:hypothetical protein